MALKLVRVRRRETSRAAKAAIPSARLNCLEIAEAAGLQNPEVQGSEQPRRQFRRCLATQSALGIAPSIRPVRSFSRAPSGPAGNAASSTAGVPGS